MPDTRRSSYSCAAGSPYFYCPYDFPYDFKNSYDFNSPEDLCRSFYSDSYSRKEVFHTANYITQSFESRSSLLETDSWSRNNITWTFKIKQPLKLQSTLSDQLSSSNPSSSSESLSESSSKSSMSSTSSSPPTLDLYMRNHLERHFVKAPRKDLLELFIKVWQEQLRLEYELQQVKSTPPPPTSASLPTSPSSPYMPPYLRQASIPSASPPIPTVGPPFVTQVSIVKGCFYYHNKYVDVDGLFVRHKHRNKGPWF